MNYLGCSILREGTLYWVFTPWDEFIACTDTREDAEGVVDQWERDTEHLVLGSRN